jgi:hypothetical protein
VQLPVMGWEGSACLYFSVEGNRIAALGEDVNGHVDGSLLFKYRVNRPYENGTGHGMVFDIRHELPLDDVDHLPPGG